MSQGCGCQSLKCSFNVLSGTKAKLEGRGQATPKTAPPCASRTTILNQVLTGHRIYMSTGSPQSKTHGFLKDNAKGRPHKSNLISCVGGVTPHHRDHICFKPSSTSVRPYDPLSIQCLVSASLTGMASCHTPTATWWGSKVTPNPEHAHDVNLFICRMDHT